MKVMKNNLVEIIDQQKQNIRLDHMTPSVAQITLELGGFAMRFSHVERTPRYDDGRRENDVEHSFMLSLVATEIAHRFYPDQLDSGLVAQLSNVHDLPEIIVNDTATFKMSDDYNVHSLEELVCCHGEIRKRIEARFGEFPELIFAYEELSLLFEEHYATALAAD